MCHTGRSSKAHEVQVPYLTRATRLPNKINERNKKIRVAAGTHLMSKTQ